MQESVRDLIERDFRAVEAKDKSAVLACFADDGVFYDPHFPESRMVGHAAIGAGLDWAFSSMESFQFDITSFLISADGTSAAVETRTRNTIKGGRQLDFLQAFFVDVHDGKITRMQAYEPYGPGGIMGFALGIQQRIYRLRHR